MIPIKYNLRNLRVRWKTTLLTVLATGLVVWSSCILFGMVEGLEYSLTISGDPLDLIVLRKGSSSEVGGGFLSDKADDLLNLPGIARDEQGQPLAAKELLNIPLAERVNGTRTNVISAGFSRPRAGSVPISRSSTAKTSTPVRASASSAASCPLIQGSPGRRRALFWRQGNLSRRRHLFGRGQRGRKRDLGRPERCRTKYRARRIGLERPDPGRQSRTILTRLRKTIDDDTQFKLAAIPESTYFESQSRSGAFLKVVGTLIAVLLTFGAMFAAANTMFSAVKLAHPRNWHHAGSRIFTSAIS